MSNPNQRQRRTSDLRVRIARSMGESFGRCQVYPCGNRPTAGSGEGLNRLYCRKHIEHYRRHGSYVKKVTAAASCGRTVQPRCNGSVSTRATSRWIAL